MSQLINEMLLRLSKIVGAVIIGAIIWLIAVGAFHATPSVELGLLCWISAALSLLLLESSPI